MIYELRIYRFHKEKKKNFLAGFRKAKTFMKKYGINFVAAFENPDRDDEFVWIRSFRDNRVRDKAIEAFYSSPEWLKVVHQIRPNIRRREVRVLKALPNSGLT